jgi:acetylornithine deacetylase/succinyl-diaminopimelate desuccinylase-like protein
VPPLESSIARPSPVSGGRLRAFVAVLLALGAGPVAAQETLDGGTSVAVDPSARERIERWQRREEYARAAQLLREREAELVELQIRFAAIPTHDYRAPLRAAFLQEELRAAGCEDVRQDAAGNVLARLPGSRRGAPVVVLGAHLDTVFPDLDSIAVVREGTILRGPGIGDDAAGLAALVHLSRALREARLPLRYDLWFVGTVGEEGEGDLRGVRALFSGELAQRAVVAFVSLDVGNPHQIVTEGVGSRRLHAVVLGPGGHSWGHFGRPNPIHALSRAIDAFLSEPIPEDSRTTFNVGVIDGGRGVNVIPDRASLRVDLRSESQAALDAVERRFRAALDTGIVREQSWSRGDGRLELRVETIGDRPVGRTPPESELVRVAVAAFAARGFSPALGSASTDANWPMRLGVPAIAIAHGCRGHQAHAIDEWCDTAGRADVLAAQVLLLAALSEREARPVTRRLPTD